MDANGIAQVAPGEVGIHLSWSGPRSWVYAPSGWTVQRRRAGRLEARDCERLDAAAIAELRQTASGSCASADHVALRRLAPTVGRPRTVRQPRRRPRSSGSTSTDDTDWRGSPSPPSCRSPWRSPMAGSSPSAAPIRERPPPTFCGPPRIDALVVVTLDPSLLQVCVDVRSAAGRRVEQRSRRSPRA